MKRLINWFNILIKKRKELKRWQRIVTVLAAVITFATTYALILPAITVEKNNTEEVAGMYLEQEKAQTDMLEENAIEPGFSIAADQENAVTFAYADDDMSATAIFSTDEEIPEGAELVVNLVDRKSEEYADLSSRSAGLLDKEFIYDVTTCSFYDFALICDNADVTPEKGLVDIQIIFRNNTVEHINDVVYVGRYARPAEKSNGSVKLSTDTAASADGAAYAVDSLAAHREAEETTDTLGTEDELITVNADESSVIELSCGIITTLSLKGSDLARSDSIIGILAGNVDEEIKAAAAETDAEIPEDAEISENDESREENAQGAPDDNDDEEITAAQQVKTLKASGSDYTVILTYDETSGIPEGALLTATEIAQDSEEYQTYLKETKKAMGLSEEETLPRFAARFFDIKIMVGNDEFTPESGVSVEITYTEPLAENTDAEVSAVHFADEKAEAEVLEANTAEVQDDGRATVEFTAESFSVYGVVYTVDFHWEVNGKTYDFSIPGGGFVTLRQLVEVLGIANSDADSESTQNEGSQAENVLTMSNVVISEKTREFVADVEKVEFSSPELVWLGKVVEENTVGGLKTANRLECEYSAELTEEQIEEINRSKVEGGDWALISLLPFTSEESLTVTMKNREQFVIKVTDWQAANTNMNDFARGNSNRFVIWGTSNGQDYVLKTDGTTEVFNRNNIDSLGADYLWTIDYGWRQGWDGDLRTFDERYRIRPANDRSRYLTLANDGTGYTASGDGLVLGAECGIRLYPPYSSHKNQQYNYYTNTNAGWIVEGWGWMRLLLGNGTGSNKFEGNSRYCSDINISRQQPPYNYDIIVSTDDYTRGGVSGFDKNGINRQVEETFTATTYASSGYDKVNQREIKAVPLTQKWVFDYWDLDGKTLYWDRVQNRIVFEENANTEIYTRLNGERASVINAGALPISFNGMKLTAHFKRNPEYEAPDDDKDGRPIDETIGYWLESLKNADFPLNKEGTQKTAELYDYENRIYRVDITAKSNLYALANTVKLGFIMDVSLSMEFPSQLDMVDKNNKSQTTTEKNDQLKLKLCDINQNSNNKNWLDTSKTYYIIADSEGTMQGGGTATVDKIAYRNVNGSRDWYWKDASKADSAYKKIDTDTKFHSNDGVGLTYPIYMAGDLVTTEDLAGEDGDLLRSLGLTAGTPKTRRFYLQKSMATTIDTLQAIMDKVSVAENISDSKDVLIAWNTFHGAIAGSDHTFRSPANVSISYAYDGGTSTQLALDDASDFGWGSDGDTTRIAILITDGAPQKSGTAISNDTVNRYAEALKGRGTQTETDDITLVTLGLSMGDVRRGEILLYDIASRDQENVPYYYEAESGNELELALAEIIRIAMANAIVQGNVTDTVNEAFYPVDKYGIVLENGNVINPDGDMIAFSEGELTQEQRDAGYGVIHESNGVYSVTWTGQEFSWDGWRGTIYEKAKEDFLGGNAVRTNDPMHPAVVTSTGYKLKPGDPAIELNQDMKNEGTKTLETPRVNVNELQLTNNNTEWTVYLGTNVNPLEQIKALYNEIRVQQVITNGTDTDTDGFKDKALWDWASWPYYFEDIIESASDDRDNDVYGEQGFFYLKDLIKKLNGGNDINWAQLIALSEETGDDNTGLTFPYDLYGQDNPGWITIKLEKDHDVDAHATDQVGTPVETYKLNVFFSPLYDHIPVGQGGDGLYPYHTGNHGNLGSYGIAAGTEDIDNNHVINVFAKKLQLLKVDQSEKAITQSHATFKLYREALEGEEDLIIDAEDVPSVLPSGKSYILADTLTTDDEGKAVTNIDISKLPDNSPYYLVETGTPHGYVPLNGAFEVRAMTDAEMNGEMVPQDVWTKVPVATPPVTSNTKWNPYVLSNWQQNATIIVKGDGELNGFAIHDGNIVYDHNQEVNMVEVNYKIRNDEGVVLPNTGGLGTNKIYQIGITLMSLAVAGVLLKKRRNTVYSK